MTQQSQQVRVLCVDDEPHVLEGLNRVLHRFFDLTTAVGPEAAIATARDRGPFPIVVSDLRMPGMDGLQLLQELRAKNPDSVCLLLSGDADFSAVLQAINDGHVFRFLTKPCPGPILIRSLKAAERQYELLSSEKILLEQTVRGCVNALCEVLGIASPEAFGRATKLKRWVSGACELLRVPDAWHVEVAALLSQIGWVAVPQGVIRKVRRQEPLSEDEDRALKTVPDVAKGILAGIPRLGEIVDLLHSVGPFIAGSEPADDRLLKTVSNKILASALALDGMLSRGVDPAVAFRKLRSRTFHAPEVLDALAEVVAAQGTAFVEKELTVGELRGGMSLLEDVRTPEGALLVSAGQDVTGQLIIRLKNARAQLGAATKILCRVPNDFRPSGERVKVSWRP